MDALLAEYSQLDKQDIFDPQRIEALYHGEKSEALHLITMVKEKKGWSHQSKSMCRWT